VAPLGDSISVRVNLERRPMRSSNVACLLEGSDPERRGRAVVYTAHYDHLGMGLPDAHGDSIYNGFSDNSAGVAMLLAIAQAMGPVPGPAARHSVLFLFFTGEEQGLLGSDYFVSRPLWPLDSILGVINLDAGAPPARPWSWRIAGGDTGPLGRLARDVAADHGWSATTSPATPNSDYFPFVRNGVPAIFIVPGPGPFQGLSVDSSQALRRRWDRYHQPGDEWAPDFPFAGVARYAEYAYYVGRALDEGRRDRRPGPPVL
jgi:Zn-dependent M28 family amino/carboxypeptidase